MSQRLQGKVALITGAGGGIGGESALLFAAEGAAVVAVDVDESAANECARRVKAAGGRALSIFADVSQDADCARMVKEAEKAFGKLDVLFNNAGIMDSGDDDAVKTSEAVWERTMAINLKGVFLGCKRALREMLPRGRGRIINMASVAGLNGTGGGAAYVAAKHGVVGLTRQMAVVYSSRGITVNCVCPGPILTGLRQHSQAILGPGVPGREVRRRTTLAFRNYARYMVDLLWLVLFALFYLMR